GCAVAACGDNRGDLVDGATAPPEPACRAVFSENFAETWVGLPGCAGLLPSDGHATLRLAIPVQMIAAQLDIAIDLGAAPAAGTYTSQSLATPWSADALHAFDMPSCLYHPCNGSG